MKLVWLLCLSLVMSFTAKAVVQEDIVFKSRFDLESSETFINQLRIFLKHNNFGDPYSQTFDAPIVIDLAQIIKDVPEDTQDWVRDLQSILQLKPFESEYKVIVEKFGYALSDFNTDFKPGASSTERVEYVTVNYVKGLHLFADKIIFEVNLKQTRSQEPLKFKVELIRPEFFVKEDVIAELPMGWTTSVLPKNVLLSLELVNIEKLMQQIVLAPSLIDLRVKDLVIPEVALKVGNKKVTFDRQKIMNFFTIREEDMKSGILDLINVRMHERFANILKDKPQQLLLPRSVNFESEIDGAVTVQSMAVNNTGIVQVDMDGFFCDSSKSFALEECKNNRIVTKPRRVITEASFNRSMREINRSLIEKSTNVAVSMSEEYINQLIEATVQSGLWEQKLAGKDFKLGPEKSFILADEKGENFSLYLDIIYKLKGAQRIMVGRSELRFPIRLMIGLNVEEIRGDPHFTIKVNKIGTDRNLLLKGAPELKLPSTVGTVRFQNKVISAIMEEVNAFQNNTLVDLEMLELKGTYLKNLKFFSDGNGRGSATIGFGKTIKGTNLNN